MPRILLAALLTLLLAAAPAQAQEAEFVRVEDGNFVIASEPYHFIGVNFWFGAQLGAGDAEARARLERELDHLQRLGVTNIRLMASSEGPDTEPWRVRPAIQPSPGVYNEDLLQGLDYLLAEMGERGMRGVLILNNFFQWTGGMAQYVSWATGEPIPYPEQDGNTWDDFQSFSARFYSNDEAQQLFEDYVQMLIYRENTVTGELYREDPTIMTWQLSNEPRAIRNAEHYVPWIDRAASFIQRHAPHQLVSLGGEGTLTPYEDVRFELVSRSLNLDYLTVHLWIENWGWYDPANPEATFNQAVGRTMGYLAKNIAVAEELGKPVVVEEFGVSRDALDYAPEAPTVYRDRFFETVFEALYYLAQEGTVVAGGNVWSWSGESRPAEPGAYWAEGDPLTGDPPHERQGWYGIYDADASTLELLDRYATLMDALGAPEAAPAE